MLRTSIPAISFTTSHRALMMKASRPILGGGMTSKDRLKAAWDELPFQVYGMARKDQFAWFWKNMYDFCIRDSFRTTKARYIQMYVGIGMLVTVFVNLVAPIWFYYIPYNKFPDSFMNPELNRAHAQRHGFDVWCADGKFVRPYFHINPPMLTMTADEL